MMTEISDSGYRFPPEIIQRVRRAHTWLWCTDGHRQVNLTVPTFEQPGHGGAGEIALDIDHGLEIRLVSCCQPGRNRNGATCGNDNRALFASRLSGDSGFAGRVRDLRAWKRLQPFQPPRNRYAADYFARLGFATLLFDLLTEAEARDRRNVFDTVLLGARVVEAIDFLRADERTSMLPIGLFGASTGAGAAIVAGAARPHEVSAIVSRGGRPDLAGDSLRAVRAPTLLIVGGADHDVLGLNRSAQTHMRCETSLVVVPGPGIFSRRRARWKRR
jgi:hypothetical protein